MQFDWAPLVRRWGHGPLHPALRLSQRSYNVIRIIFPNFSCTWPNQLTLKTRWHLWDFLKGHKHQVSSERLFIIDRVALEKKGDNRICSVRLSVRPSVRVFVDALCNQAAYADNLADAVDQLLIFWCHPSFLVSVTLILCRKHVHGKCHLIPGLLGLSLLSSDFLSNMSSDGSRKMLLYIILATWPHTDTAAGKWSYCAMEHLITLQESHFGSLFFSVYPKNQYTGCENYWLSGFPGHPKTLPESQEGWSLILKICPWLICNYIFITRGTSNFRRMTLWANFDS